MQWALRSFVISTLILSVAVPLPLASVQAGPHSQETPDQGVQTSERAAITTRPATHSTPSVGLDSVFVYIDVHSNGTAEWRIEYRVRLDDRTTETAFERLQQNLRNESTPAREEFYDRIRQSIRTAENTTGREMSGTNFDAHTTVRQIPEELGVVVYSFQWQGFANASGQRIRVGGALEGFLLESDERLEISWPAEYELAEVEPEADSREDATVAWQGPMTFGSQGPQLVLAPRSSSQPPFLLFSVVAVAALVAFFGLLQRQRSGADTDTLSQLAKRIHGDTGDTSEESELLSNEEQVLRLLADHGGRVKQQTVADKLGWTSTKTSYVVSNLREDGQIQSFRLGRENVLILPESNNAQQQEA